MCWTETKLGEVHEHEDDKEASTTSAKDLMHGSALEVPAGSCSSRIEGVQKRAHGVFNRGPALTRGGTGRCRDDSGRLGVREGPRAMIGFDWESADRAVSLHLCL